MNLKCGYFTVGGIMCGSLVGIFVGALAVNASLGYMILLLGAWGLCLYITSRSLMDDARREEAVLNQPAEEFDVHIEQQLQAVVTHRDLLRHDTDMLRAGRQRKKHQANGPYIYIIEDDMFHRTSYFSVENR